jgi:hypothetical protein
LFLVDFPILSFTLARFSHSFHACFYAVDIWQTTSESAKRPLFFLNRTFPSHGFARLSARSILLPFLLRRNSELSPAGSVFSFLSFSLG